jgi:hypothetical protein
MAGKHYCKNFDKDKVTCIMCIENAIFTVKSCYKPENTK